MLMDEKRLSCFCSQSFPSTIVYDWESKFFAKKMHSLALNMTKTMSPLVAHLRPITATLAPFLEMSAGKQLGLVQTGICALEFLILPEDAMTNC